EFVVGVEPRPLGTQQVWFTLDCSGADQGHPLCRACAHPDSMAGACRVDAAGHLTMMAARGSRSAVALDLDGDGDLDLVTNELDAGPQAPLSGLAPRCQAHHL